MTSKAFRADDNLIIDNDSSEANETVMNLSKNNKSRNSTHMPNIGAIKELFFLNLNVKKVFNYLWQVFIKTLILQHFDLKSHIQIKTDISGYVIGVMLSQLNLNSNILSNYSNLNNFDFD